MDNINTARPHLGDILYDKPGNLNFESEIEKVQYRPCITITSAIQGTSRERLCDELGLMSLSRRHWHNKLNFFYKIVNRQIPDIPQRIFFLKMTIL